MHHSNSSETKEAKEASRACSGLLSSDPSHTCIHQAPRGADAIHKGRAAMAASLKIRKLALAGLPSKPMPSGRLQDPSRQYANGGQRVTLNRMRPEVP